VEYNVAFHFKSNKEKEQFQKRDNIVEFGTKTVRHEPKVIPQELGHNLLDCYIYLLL
jgi:hypothetical protein